jgi:hypothetical protein
MSGIMAPIVVPKKPPVCRGKAAGSGGPCPLGAAMDSSAFADAEKYCHNGGLAFAHQSTAPPGQITGAQIVWSAGAIITVVAPIAAPKNARFAGITAGGAARPRVRRWTRLPLPHHAKYCHNGGMAFAHDRAGKAAPAGCRPEGP